MNNKNELSYVQGVMSGLPIGLAYLTVSFTFGLASVQAGLPVWLATVISATNLTSAGQFAAMTCIAVMGSIAEIALVTLTINLRYVLMSLSLAQQLGKKVNTMQRALMSFFITDEIFALATLKGDKLNFKHFMGIATTPYIGWVLGTFLGSMVTQLLPTSLQSAMGIALYCMFIAIIIPPCRSSKPITVCILIAVALSCLFYYTPYLKELSSGFRVIICSILSAVIAALIFPIKDEGKEIEQAQLLKGDGEIILENEAKENEVC